MKAKKFFVAIMAVVIIVSSVCAFVACDIKLPEGYAYTLVVPDGAPALAVANLDFGIEVDSVFHDINKKVVSSSIISTEAIKQDVDMAIVPANLAAKIFNENGGYKLLAVVTNGNLYMMSSMPSEVASLQDLKGKMVYSIGQSSIPDMIFKTLLSSSGIEYTVGEEAVDGKVVIKYCQDGSDAIAQLAAAKAKEQLVFGIYAEPAVTNSKAKGFEEVFDLQELWAQSSSSNQNGYAQAVLIARDSVCENSEFVTKLLDAFKANQESILQDSAKAIQNIKDIYPQSALPSTMTSQVIGRCNINTIKADADGRAYFEHTLNAVKAINANLIGGKLPSDDFYLA